MRNPHTDPQAAACLNETLSPKTNACLALALPVLALGIGTLSYLPAQFAGASQAFSLRPVEAHQLQHSPVRLSNQGYWTTQGAAVLDATGTPVKIAGINWSGLETTRAVPGGLDYRSMQSIVNDIRRAGFNTIRVPFSNEMVEHPRQGHRELNLVDDALNNADSMEILDQLVEVAGRAGLKVILDNHRSGAGSSAESSGLWYTAEYPEAAWIQDWTALARRYKGNSTVVAFDLRNEPHNATSGGSCWGCGGARDWRSAAERAGNAILAENPNVLIMVEGTDQFQGDGTWWGGNLSGAERNPIQLSTSGHVIYSVHEYGPSEYQQPWFTAGTTRASLESMWERRWGFLTTRNIAPVVVGEFGTGGTTADVTSDVPGSQGHWFRTFTDYLHKKPETGWIYWGINGDDRYGFLSRDYSTGNEKEPLRAALSELAHSRPLSATPVRQLEALTEEVTQSIQNSAPSTQVPKVQVRTLTEEIALNVQQSTRRALAGSYSR